MLSIEIDMVEEVNLINAYLREISANFPFDKEIKKLISDVLNSGGKRIRPIISILVYEMMSNKTRDEMVYNAACSIEFIHNASLLVDDIFDKDIFRRQKKAFYLRFSTFSAISMSYSLSSLALNLALKTGYVSVIEEVAKSTHNLATSIFLEKKFRDGQHKMDKKEALLLIDRKTSSLFQAASSIGAILAKSNEEEIKQIREFGTYFGRVFQLRDDYLSIISTQEELGKSGAVTDIKNRIQTYLVLEALELADTYDKEILNDYYINQADYEIELIRDIIKRSGAVEAIKNLVNEYIVKAKKILDSYPDNIAKEKLLQLLQYLELK